LDAPWTFKKVARNRPDATNQNHQYTFRRVDIHQSSIFRTTFPRRHKPDAPRQMCDGSHSAERGRIVAISFYSPHAPIDDRDG
jgi:hypothetical protein